jgi:hypothetical protein
MIRSLPVTPVLFITVVTFICCGGSLFAQPVNDNCSDASVLTSGVPVTYSTLTATVDGPPPSCASGDSPDIWFQWTADCDGEGYITTCGSSYDTVLTIYASGTGCPALGVNEIACNESGPDCYWDSQVYFPTFVGETYLVQIGGWGGESGDGTVTAVCNGCGNLGVLDCAFDCNELLLSWTDNPLAVSYEIFENDILIDTLPAGTSTYSMIGASGGVNEYRVTAPCSIGTGASLEVSCSSVGAIPAAGTDLILAMEKLNPNGPGDIDSGDALESALLALGRTPVVFAAPDFDTIPCLDLNNYSVVWVLTGTYLAEYFSTVAELDALAAYLQGGEGNLYFESADHWFYGEFSLLDSRDGVEQPAEDGDDSFTTMNGQNAATIGLDLSAQAAVVYTQDTTGYDWTDHLLTSGTTVGVPPDLDVVSAEAIWRNNDDTGGEPDYIVAIVAEATDGSRMISSSFEFGGFSADPAQQTALAMSYLTVLDPSLPPSDDFQRGDCNQDSAFNIADAVFMLAQLFSGGATGTCADACDSNDDGSINIADAVHVLAALFSGGPNPPDPGPGPGCGPDPTDDALDCETPCT